jgi:hypothetical protein
MSATTIPTREAQPPTARRQTIRQISAHALRQTKRLGGTDMVLTWEAGEVIGKTLALIGMRRRCQGHIDFDLAILLEHVLGLDAVARTPEQRARQALFVAICKEFEQAARWGYEHQAFRFTFDDEGAAMRGAVSQAGQIVERWRAWREAHA